MLSDRSGLPGGGEYRPGDDATRPTGVLDRLYGIDTALTCAAASWDGTLARRVLPVVEESAEHTKLWWGAAALLAACGGRRGRRAAVTGIAGMWLGQAVGGAAKHLWDRPRPPKELIPHAEVNDRPDSSSFPSGHTVAAVAFTASVAVAWPLAGAACAVPAVAVSLQRVHSGAHYPSDVAAGAVIGLAGAGLARRASAVAAARLAAARVGGGKWGRRVAAVMRPR